MIELRGVSKTYHRGTHDVHAVRDVDLDIPSGQFTLIMGPSGSGKSTLLYLIGCLDTPTAGSITLDGEDLARLSSNARAQLRGRRIGFVFQSFHQISNLSAVENVELPLLLAGVKRAGARSRAEAALDRVGLAPRLHHRPTELSGGELQRVAIARALINDPDLILADEPTGNLDTATGTQVLGFLKELKDGGKTCIMVTHNPAFADEADVVVLMRDGRQVEAHCAMREMILA